MHLKHNKLIHQSVSFVSQEQLNILTSLFNYIIWIYICNCKISKILILLSFYKLIFNFVNRNCEGNLDNIIISMLIITIRIRIFNKIIIYFFLGDVLSFTHSYNQLTASLFVTHLAEFQNISTYFIASHRYMLFSLVITLHHRSRHHLVRGSSRSTIKRAAPNMGSQPGMILWRTPY